jgi:uncharacterized membrane protein YkvA (DUF1232 family)
MNEEVVNLEREEPGNFLQWTQHAQRLKREIRIFYFVFRHPRTPWHARVIAACVAGYPFSPIQIIPSFIPVIGFLDDFLVLFLGAKLLHKMIPQDVFMECCAFADSSAMRSDERSRSSTAAFAFGMVAAVWLVVAVGTSVLMATYVFR